MKSGGYNPIYLAFAIITILLSKLFGGSSMRKDMIYDSRILSGNNCRIGS